MNDSARHKGRFITAAIAIPSSGGGMPAKNVNCVSRELGRYASAERAVIAQNFFKTGPGEYGEGDIFIGVRVPDVRRVAKNNLSLSLADLLRLLRSKIHEERLLALVILAVRFRQGNQLERSKIFRSYLANTKYINNWDLVDVSAPNVIGEFLIARPRKPLYKLARSGSLWERRIAIVSTFAFIKQGDFATTIEICSKLLNDREDLIHKAAGWMLREVGKRDSALLKLFLNKHGRIMPRTMLRYSIEGFPAVQRKRYLNL